MTGRTELVAAVADRAGLEMTGNLRPPAGPGRTPVDGAPAGFGLKEEHLGAESPRRRAEGTTVGAGREHCTLLLCLGPRLGPPGDHGRPAS